MFGYPFGCLFSSSTQRGIKAAGFPNGKLSEFEDSLWRFCLVNFGGLGVGARHWLSCSLLALVCASFQVKHAGLLCHFMLELFRTQKLTSRDSDNSQRGKFVNLQLAPFCLQSSFFAYSPCGCLLDGFSHCKRRSSIVSKNLNCK